MGPSNSNVNKRLKDNKKLNSKIKLFFDQEPDKQSDYILDHKQFMKKLNEIENLEQLIKTISIYKTPIYQNQWTNWYLHRKYVCIQTQSGWWSIENNNEGLTIQKNKNLGYVRDHYRRNLRCNTKYWSPQLVEHDVGQSNLKQLFQWIQQNALEKNNYNWYNDNSQHFARKLFNQFAKTKDIDLGA